MNKNAENKKENKKKKFDYFYFLTWRFVISFFVIAILCFLAVYHFAEAFALHETDTVDIGESIILESEKTLTESRIEGVSDIFQLSEELADLSSTHAEWTKIKEDPSQKGFFCIAEDKSTECVYNIDQNNICSAGYNLKDFDYVWVDSFSGSFYTIINISGRVVDFSNYYFLVRDSSANLASRLIINCYEAEEVVLKNTILTGTLIAPAAHVTYKDTVVNGQVYAVSSSGVRSSYRDIAFSGYYKMMSALKKAKLDNECVRQYSVDYLKSKFPLVYGDVPSNYVPGEKDLARIPELIIHDANVEDLTEDLKYFTKLKGFYCSNSTIGKVDFSGMKYLNEILFSESTVTNLNFGDIKELLKVTLESCKIDKVDLAGCPELVSLNYRGTPIKNLVLPENSKIIYLNCKSSEFTGFSEKQIASLSELLYLDAEDNPKLESMDLSVLPKLKKVNLTNCGIRELSFENCAELYFAKCSKNLFETIDLSTAPALIYFEAYSVYLQEVDVTGLFKRGFADLYIYDAVTITDNDPPQPPKNPENTKPGATERPDDTGGTGVPDETLVPETSIPPASTAAPDETQPSDENNVPDSTDNPGTTTGPDSTASPEPDDSDVEESPDSTEAPVSTDLPVSTEPPGDTDDEAENESDA